MSSSEENVRKKTIDDLPDEILEYILSLVSPYKDSESCKEVSRRWCRTINSVNQHSKCDLYRSVLNSNVLWQCIVPPNFGPTTYITKRYSHAACYCGKTMGLCPIRASDGNVRRHWFKKKNDNFMYVFGGCTLRCTMFNDLWTLDLSNRKWIRPYSTGCYPSPKACATMCCYNKRLILFGGWTHPPPYPLHQIQRLFNELHIYDITSNTWDIIHSPVTPPPMAGHSATVHGNNMIVFGGLQWGGSLFLYSSSNDVWCFNFESLCWSKPETSETKPKTRHGQSQIYLNDENLMIMGGCQGPNSILDDVWILTMTKGVWVWKQLKVNNGQWAAPHLWCHPACRVGDVVVVFSCGTPQALSHYTSCSPVRTSPPPTPQDASIPPEVVARQASQGPLPNEKDVNVNGQRGSLGKKSTDEASTSSNSSSEDASHSPNKASNGERSREPQPHCSGRSSRLNGEIQMAAFRSESPCSCHSNSKNRIKQLESLKKMEARYKNPARDDKSKSGKSGDPNDPNPGPSGNSNSANKMSMYVMDISEALSENGSVTWKPPRTNWNAPRDTVFHSLVLGKGELIIFGGVQKNSSASAIPVASYKSVSNTTHIITAPRNIV